MCDHLYCPIQISLDDIILGVQINLICDTCKSWSSVTLVFLLKLSCVMTRLTFLCRKSPLCISCMIWITYCSFFWIMFMFFLDLRSPSRSSSIICFTKFCFQIGALGFVQPIAGVHVHLVELVWLVCHEILGVGFVIDEVCKWIKHWLSKGLFFCLSYF